MGDKPSDEIQANPASPASGCSGAPTEDDSTYDSSPKDAAQPTPTPDGAHTEPTESDSPDFLRFKEEYEAGGWSDKAIAAWNAWMEELMLTQR